MKTYKVVYVDPKIRLGKDKKHVIQIAALNDKDILETFHMPGTKARVTSLSKTFCEGIKKEGFCYLLN